MALQFTRYLYSKEDVKHALVISILKKNQTEAMFWFEELFASGFVSELQTLLTKMYYDFFAMLNPDYEDQLTTNTNTIVTTLLQLPFNTDVFFLRQVCENFEIEMTYNNDCSVVENMTAWIATKDCRSFAKYIYDSVKDTELQATYRQICKAFKKKSTYQVMSKHALLAKVMQQFQSRIKTKVNAKALNTIPIPIPQEKILLTDNVVHYHILKQEGLQHHINSYRWLHLFARKHTNEEVNHMYFYDWLYYASFAPIWNQRIEQFGGEINHTKKQVIFNNEDLLQEFYGLYGLEPDEQPKHITNKHIWIEANGNVGWKQFYNEFSKDSSTLVQIYDEELEEFDKDKVTY